MKKILPFLLILFVVANSQFTLTVVSVSGVTKDEITDSPVVADIFVKDKTGKTINRTKSNGGKYFITGLKPGNEYSVELKSNGYFLKSYELIIPNTDKYEEISRDFTLTPKKQGLRIPVKVIPFDKGKTQVREGADYVFHDIIQIMKRNRRIEFEIEVFPSKDGDLQSAQERANSLKSYFESKKVRSPFTVKPYSKLDPDNLPPTGKSAKGKRYKGSIYITVKKV